MKRFFRLIGWVLIFAGVIGVFVGLTSNVTVYTPGSYAPYAGYIEPSQTVNFHKMFGALSLLLAGGLSVVAGAVFAVGAEMLRPPADGVTGQPASEASDRSGLLMAAAVIGLGFVIVVSALAFGRTQTVPPPPARTDLATDAAAPGYDARDQAAIPPR